MHTYEVVVGNVGTIYAGTNAFKALQAYGSYKKASQAECGRADGDIIIFKDGEVWCEYRGKCHICFYCGVPEGSAMPETGICCIGHLWYDFTQPGN